LLQITFELPFGALGNLIAVLDESRWPFQGYCGIEKMA